MYQIKSAPDKHAEEYYKTYLDHEFRGIISEKNVIDNENNYSKIIITINKDSSIVYKFKGNENNEFSMNAKVADSLIKKKGSDTVTVITKSKANFKLKFVPFTGS